MKDDLRELLRSFWEARTVENKPSEVWIAKWTYFTTTPLPVVFEDFATFKSSF